MATVSFQVIDGLEMGQVFRDLPTPVSIGREEDNVIRLNDERVSRFHAKVQEHDGRIILTDLDSTNGTRVNGHAVRMRILQIGDQVLVGRCLLLYGAPEEIAARVERLQAAGAAPVTASSAAEAEDPDFPGELFPEKSPATPHGLTLGQAAEVSEIVSFAHSRILRVLRLAQQQGNAPSSVATDWMAVPPAAWLQLGQVEVELARYLRELADPGDGPAG